MPKTLTKDKVLEALVDEHIEYILIKNPTPADYLYSILMNGFKGYWNLTDKELEVEYEEIFEEKVKIEGVK